MHHRFRLIRRISIGVALLLLTMIIGCSVLPDWSLPPLLRNLPATGGNTSLCPVPLELKSIANLLTPADAPEFNGRLSREFPQGSSEAHLVERLRNLEFEMLAPCRDDPTIRTARF